MQQPNVPDSAEEVWIIPSSDSEPEAEDTGSPQRGTSITPEGLRRTNRKRKLINDFFTASGDPVRKVSRSTVRRRRTITTPDMTNHSPKNNNVGTPGGRSTPGGPRAGAGNLGALGAGRGEKEKSAPTSEGSTLEKMMKQMAEMNGFMKGMEGRLRDDIKGVEAGMEAKFGKALKGLEDRVVRNEKELPKIISGIVDRVVDEKMKKALPGGSRGACAGPSNPKEERYWLARRSLRMWPIPGPSPRKSVEIFPVSYTHLTLPTIYSV